MVMEELWVVRCGNPSSVALILPCIYILFNNNVVNLHTDIDNLLCSSSILGQVNLIGLVVLVALLFLCVN